LREQATSFAACYGMLTHHNWDQQLRRIVVDLSETDKTGATLRVDPVGGSHFEQSIAVWKVTNHFWWRRDSTKVCNYVHFCSVCENANPSYKVPATTLHTVYVKALFHRLIHHVQKTTL